jgi:5-hydroxyisourate hydrolase
MMISTHVQDTARGLPAARVSVELDIFVTGFGWKEAGHGVTNAEGRISEFGEPAAPGLYRLMYDIAAYQNDAFFPSIAIVFEVRDPTQTFHIPLAISPFGYSTYRGFQE